MGGAWNLLLHRAHSVSPCTVHVDPSRLTAARSPREVRNVWRRVRVPIVAAHCARIRSQPEDDGGNVADAAMACGVHAEGDTSPLGPVGSRGLGHVSTLAEATPARLRNAR